MNVRRHPRPQLRVVVDNRRPPRPPARPQDLREILRGLFAAMVWRG